MKKTTFLILLLGLYGINASAAVGKKDDKTDKKVKDINYSGLKFRNIGPALTSGRIADFGCKSR